MAAPPHSQSPAMPAIFSQSTRSRSSSNTTQSSSRAPSFMSSFRPRVRDALDTVPATVPRKRLFAAKRTKKHHAFDPKLVPYPVSYDQRVVTLDVLDHIFVQGARKNNVTWVDFKEGTPKRSLDLGCGTGDWVMEAARQWKDCHFVGFDVVPNQPNLFLLKDRGIADRIQWVQGNFLTGKLPFEDNSFDHVHVYRIAWGVAEDQWDELFEDIARVLRPGGAIEIGEEDILFPVLPNSYTMKLRHRPTTPHRPSLTLSPPLSPVNGSKDLHAHALFESLFFGVFDSRKINCRPTSIIPHYLNIHFRHVISTPNVELPMPPPPVARQQLRHVPSDCTARPTGMRQSGDSPSTSDFSPESSSSSESLPEQLRQQQTPPTSATDSATSLLSKCRSGLSAGVARPGPEKLIHAVSGSFEPGDLQGNLKLLPPVSIDLDNRSLAVHLNSMFQRILACKEAMWGELQRRLQLRNTGGPDLLSCYGWDDLENDMGSGDVAHRNNAGWGTTRELDLARTLFDEITTRFERDMVHRTALADAVESVLGWKKPAPEPVTKHERARQKELERAIAAAARAESQGQEQMQVSRSFKGFIGFKEGRKW